MKIAFLTLGCKVNSYETEKMKIQFARAGYEIVSFSEMADVYVVNTCTVTNIADRKSRKMLHRARRKNPDAIVVATGCYVDSARAGGETDGCVDVFVGNAEKEHMTSLVEKLLQEKSAEKKGQQKVGGMSEKAAQERHTRAYIKIQNGCNQYCSYCIIPYVRGTLESRPEELILQEAEALAAEGVRELVLTGIHLSSYGVEWEAGRVTADTFVRLEGRYLLELLKKLSAIDGLERLRLGSLEPRIISERFAEELARIPGVCPHFHLSLQSGCDATLQRMNRHYSAEEYQNRVDILRKYFKHPAITTDIIVGFPGETVQEFETTCRFAEQIGFAQIHVFKYSRRRGTAADRMKEQVDESVKAQRSDVLLAKSRKLEEKYQQYFEGRREQVLLEEPVMLDGKKYLTGYNERYVRFAVPESPEETEENMTNRIAEVQVTGERRGGILIGKTERACNFEKDILL